MQQVTIPSLSSLRTRDAFDEGSIDEISLAENRSYSAKVFPMARAIYVRGWALDGAAGALASEVRLVVDGSHEFATTYGHARADIATAFGSADLGRCGFEFTIPPILGAGAHGIEAYAINAEGSECLRVASLTLHVVATLVPRAFSSKTAGSALGSLEHLAGDDDTRSELEIAGRCELAIGGGCVATGWALDRANRQTFVEVGAVIDNLWYLQGRPGIERADVAKVHGVPSIPGCGFEIRFALNFVDPGPHSIVIVARRADNTWAGVGIPMTFEAVESPLPWMWSLRELRQRTSWKLDEVQLYTRDEIKSKSALPADLAIEPGSALYLSGWAIDEPSKVPAAGIYLSVDGDRRDPIPGRYGLASPPSMPRSLVAEANNCGFTAIVPTNDLDSGEHTIEVLIVSRNWNGFYPVNAMQFRIPDDMDLKAPRSVKQKSRAVAKVRFAPTDIRKPASSLSQRS